MMDFESYVIVVVVNGDLVTLTMDEIDELPLNLEHGHDVNSIIVEALKARHRKALGELRGSE